MTKQEEMKQGILNIIESHHDRITLPGTMVGQILSYLHSKGVVVRVEGELPNITCINNEDYVKGFMSGIKTLEGEIVKAGYGAFEPLI